VLSADLQPTRARRAQSERAEFDAFYLQHVQLVSRWVARLAGPDLEREDLVQEVFLIAHRRRDTFRGAAKVSTWLFGITQNVVRHRRRKERVRTMLLGAATDIGRLAPQRPTPVEEFERREATKTVYRLLDDLPDKYRDVFILFEIEGLSGAEIGALTGLNLTTVRVRLHRARSRFLANVRAQVGDDAGERMLLGQGQGQGEGARDDEGEVR
jgi:RNA polymerase sigma-70 factor (ECF subfamily)